MTKRTCTHLLHFFTRVNINTHALLIANSTPNIKKMHFRSITQSAPLPARKRHFVYNIKTFIGSHVRGKRSPNSYGTRMYKIRCNMDVARVHNGENSF